MVIPEHIAFIMDGNGRWALEQSLPRSAGHKAGYEHIPDVLEICRDFGVKIVSGFAWSTENWGRPKTEVDFIMRSLENHLPRFVQELHHKGIRFVHSGRRQALAPRARRVLDEAVELTQTNDRGVFNLAFDYGGRAEIVQVVRELVQEGMPADRICQAAISGRLWTAGLPDADLVVRTGGDRRLSNFLLWQSAYACFYVTEAYWPAITRKDIEAGLEYYNQIVGGAA